MRDAAPTARTVLVTGGSRVIGLACGRTLAAAGHRVAVTSSSTAVDEPGLLAVKCDVTDPAQVEAAISAVEEQPGAVEVLEAFAGPTCDGLLGRASADDFAAVVATNLTSTWRVSTREWTQLMRARHGRGLLCSSGQP